MKTAISVVTALTALCLALVGWREDRETMQLRARTAAVQAEILRTRDQLGARKLERDKLARTGRESAKSDRREPPKSDAPHAEPSSLTKLANDPQLQLLQACARRATLQSAYAAFFRAWHLSPAQIEAFKDAVTKHEQELDDIYAATRATGVASSDPAAAEACRQADAEYSKTQYDLLGADAARALPEFERTLNAREAVSGVAGEAALEGAPLSSDQLESLVSAMCASDVDYGKGQNVRLRTVNWAQVDAQARNFLSPEQFAIFSTAELQGPRNGGTRFLPQLHAAVERATASEQ